MRTFLLAILLAVSAPVQAWSEADTRRQVGYFVLHTIDWGQTLDISGKCSRTEIGRQIVISDGELAIQTRYKQPEHLESNPILGKCPSRGEVNRYFLLTGLTHYGISRALPQPYREWWQHVTMTFEAGVVEHNLNVGIRMRF